MANKYDGSGGAIDLIDRDIRVWVKRGQDKAIKKLETDFEGIIKRKETEALERNNIKDRVDYRLSPEAAASRKMHNSLSSYLFHQDLKL